MSQILNPLEVSRCDILDKFKEYRGPLTVDTESGKSRGLLGISLDNGRYNTYLPVNHHDVENINGTEKETIRSLFRQADSLQFHNSGYDIWDVLIPNQFLDGPPKVFYDTMNMAHWINENRFDYSLDAVSRSLGGKPKKRSSAMQTVLGMDGEDTWSDVPFNMMFEYSANDSEITHHAFLKMLPEFISQGFAGELWEWEMKFIEAMKHMVIEGIRINPELCMREILKGKAIMEECKKDLGFKWNDNIGPKNLEVLFFEKLGLPIVRRTKTGKPSFDKKAMQKYDQLLEESKDPTAQIVLRYRGWQKTVSANYTAYLKFADSAGVLHPGYKLHGTVTGRLSCENPALQQIPRISEQEWNGALKSAFIPKEGKGLWETDFSQLEFRLAAAYSEEPELVETFNSDRDLFTEMAHTLKWLRQDVKTFSYLTIYGGGANRVKEVFGVSEIEAHQMLSQFRSTYPKLDRIRRKMGSLGTGRGYIKYWTGRRRHFEYPKDEGHKGFNAAIQGGGAEIVKRAICRIDREICDDNCRLVLQVHDSVVAEITKGMENEYLPRIIEIMEDPQYDFGVQFRTETKKWGTKEVWGAAA